MMQMRRGWTTRILALLGIVSAVGVASGSIAYWSVSRRFKAGDIDALYGIVPNPIAEQLVFQNVTVWNGVDAMPLRDRSVIIRDGRFQKIIDAAESVPDGARVIDGTGRTLIPGLIDSHVHLLSDSGPDLLTRRDALIREWLETTRQYPKRREAIVRRGQLKLKAGITTMRILGDGYYELAYRDDLARWDIVGPRVLAAGLHVNGPNGYVTGGIAAGLPPVDRLEAAIELRSAEEISTKIRAHIARGIDVVKIATTHGDLGFQDARPDLPEAWVREIVELAHGAGLKVTAHSYGEQGDWAAVRGGVDGIEHLVNVPHPLPDDLVAEIVQRGIYVCPTLAGSSYSVVKFLRSPELLYQDADLTGNVDVSVRKNLYLVLRLLKVPGVARLLMRQDRPMERWDLWYRQSLANTRKLYDAGVQLVFGTDAPFVFGNFFHSVMNEVRGLKEAGLPNVAILRMATINAARALGIDDRIGTIEPGKLADAVLLEGNPVDDIEALQSVNLVVKEGRIVYRKMN
jgi:imidazolonepropionase-like amidohydrolase